MEKNKTTLIKTAVEQYIETGKDEIKTIQQEDNPCNCEIKTIQQEIDLGKKILKELK